jgi:polyisoprenoid-binding protein YceI
MTGRQLAVLFVALAAATGPRLLSDPLPARGEDRPQAAAKTYEVDTSASKVFVKVGLATRLGHPHGVQGVLKSGRVTFGGKGELVFDMASFEADAPEARKRVGQEGKKVSENEARKVTATMRGPDVLDVTRFPTATCTVRSVTPLDGQAPGRPGRYRPQGGLTLHGKEQPLQFQAAVGLVRPSGTRRGTRRPNITYDLTPEAGQRRFLRMYGPCGSCWRC